MCCLQHLLALLRIQQKPTQQQQQAQCLIDVFVDIIFLSRKVAIKNFFTAAWLPNAFS